MSIYIGEHTRVIVQGMTGREGARHTARMVAYGTNIVGGVSPGRGGEWHEGKPLFETVQNAVSATGANTSVVFVPAAAAADAIYEAVDAGIELIVCVTTGIPLLDIIRVREYIRLTPSRLIGPNSPGVLIPSFASLGTIPQEIATPGSIGIVARSSTLAYLLTHHLTQSGIGQSAIVGIGGDAVLGTNFANVLERFEDDPPTRFVVLIGEIGGYAENEVAVAIAQQMTKPVVAYIAGHYAPADGHLGHRSATVDEPGTDAATKTELLRQAGARIAETIEEIPAILMEWLPTR